MPFPAVDLSGKSQMMFRYNSGTKNGKWTIRRDSASGPVIATTIIAPTKGWELHTIDITPSEGVHDLYFTYNNPDIPQKDADKTTATFDWFLFAAEFPGKGTPGYDSAYAYYNYLLTASPSVQTPVMMENPANMFRATHVFERGNWMAKTAEVQADVPHSLNPMPEGAPPQQAGTCHVDDG